MSCSIEFRSDMLPSRSRREISADAAPREENSAELSENVFAGLGCCPPGT
jgi:hypothetical protein